MFKNSKKQGDAGLGQAIAYFTSQGYNVALPLTDSADWDIIVEIDGLLKKVQVKTSSQIAENGIMKFNAVVSGGNKTSTSSKGIDIQDWDILFLHHLITGKQALIPKESLSTNNQINIGGNKYKEFLLN
jgi:hypothetical protein